jgi:hypothetical protein
LVLRSLASASPVVPVAEKRLDSDPLHLGRSDSLVSDLSSIAKVRSVSKTAYSER